MKETLESPPADSTPQDKKNYATNQSVEKSIISANKSDKDFSTIADKKQSRIAELVHFFNQLYGKIPESHFVYLWTKQSGIFSFAISDETQREAMAKKAIELANSSIDIWHAVNPVYVEESVKKCLEIIGNGVVYDVGLFIGKSLKIFNDYFYDSPEGRLLKKVPYNPY